MNAGLESSDYLSMYYKNYRTNKWETGELTENEIAAAELDALIWWTYADLSYRHYREGLLLDDDWQNFKIELISFF